MVMLMILFLPGLIPVTLCKLTLVHIVWAVLFLPPFPPIYLCHHMGLVVAVMVLYYKQLEFVRLTMV